MNGPPRLLEEGGTETERTLLRAAATAAPSERWMRQMRTALGLTTAPIISSSPPAAAVGSKMGAGLVLKWLGASIATAALAASVAYVVHERAKPPPEHAASLAVANQVAVSPTERAPSVAPPVETAPVAVPAPAPAPAPPRVSPSQPSAKTLGLEIASLDAVRQRLVARDSAAALNALAKYHADFPAPLLGPEATVLEVQALVSDGDASHRARAIALAKRFVKMHPTSPHTPRLETLISNHEQP